MKTFFNDHFDDFDRCLQWAQQTLTIEAKALEQASSRLDQGFVNAVQLILGASGRVVVMGIGKSGHVGGKIAATLASTGTPAFFVHAAEARHGDLGMIQSQDVVIALSNSGESEELTSILPLIKRLGAKLVAITGQGQSTLAQHADSLINSYVEQEACPHNLAPTASTIVQMALGDALAMALLQAKGFRLEDFARSHPGGSLGRRLLTQVKDVMRTGLALPVVEEHASLIQMLSVMSEKGLGAVVIVNASKQVQGIFTDGDLRRLLSQGVEVRKLQAQQVLKAKPHTLQPQMLAVEAAYAMEQHRITTMIVVDEKGLLQGMLNMHDLMQAKVI